MREATHHPPHPMARSAFGRLSGRGGMTQPSRRHHRDEHAPTDPGHPRSRHRARRRVRVLDRPRRRHDHDPLLALASGYDAPAVGFLVATAAATQLGARLLLPWLLGRFTDRVLIALASLTMVAAFVLLIVSTALPIFLLAQICQGAARAVFWTSSQAHAIRDQPRPVQRLVDLNVAGNAGTLVGPALGGLLATLGLEAALAAATLGAMVAVVGSPFLRRFEPFDRRRSAGTWRLLRRSGVDLACWASVIGGLWWSMMGSYVPVILVGAGIGSIGIGWAVTASEAAGTSRSWPSGTCRATASGPPCSSAASSPAWP